MWENRDKVAEVIESELTNAAIRGDSLDDTVDNVMKKIEQAVPRLYVERLIRTESAYMTTAAQIQSFKDLGCDGAEFPATLDEVTCKTCGPLDGIHFIFEDMKEGATVPPMHPNCRCCLSPWYRDEDGDEPLTPGTRGARNPETGKWEDVPDMKYDDWKDIFVDKNKTLEEWMSGRTEAQADAKGKMQVVKDENSTLAQGLGKDNYNAVFDGIAERATDQRVVDLWNKHANNVKVISTTSIKNYFSPSRGGIFLNMKQIVTGNRFSLPYETIVHETGHAIDWTLGDKNTFSSSTWKDGKFVKTLISEVLEIIKKRAVALKKPFGDKNWRILHEMGAVDQFEWEFFQLNGKFPDGEPVFSDARVYASIANELNTSYSQIDSARLKDIMEGATNSKIYTGTGHGSTYWKKQEQSTA